MNDYSQFIESALQEAADLARNYFGNVSSSVKAGDNNQVLTEADLAIGKLLVDKVRAAYSDHNVIDEEAGVIDNHSNFTWVIDPVDGTSNFANGSPLYGILLGLLDGGQPIAGGIALPSLGEVCFATKGKGAYCNGKRIQVSQETQLLNSLVAYGIDGHQENPDLTYREVDGLADIVLGIRNLRSSNSVVDMAYVAKGVYGASLNRTSKIWDNVAPQIIIEEAGGVCTDFFGQPMDYSNPLTRVDQNFTFCGSAPELHRQLQTIIKAGSRTGK